MWICIHTLLLAEYCNVRTVFIYSEHGTIFSIFSNGFVKINRRSLFQHDIVTPITPKIKKQTCVVTGYGLMATVLPRLIVSVLIVYDEKM
jgi:hypothetical protein